MDGRTDDQNRNGVPTPQRTPIHPARESVFSRLIIVDTATTWSGSVACRIPRKNPMPRIRSPLVIVEPSGFNKGNRKGGRKEGREIHPECLGMDATVILQLSEASRRDKE